MEPEMVSSRSEKLKSRNQTSDSLLRQRESLWPEPCDLDNPDDSWQVGEDIPQKGDRKREGGGWEKGLKHLREFLNARPPKSPDDFHGTASSSWVVF